MPPTQPLRVRPPGAVPLLLMAVLSLCAPSALGQFGPSVPVNLGIGNPPDRITGVASGDLDGDGLGDLVAVDSANPGNVGLALGLGGGAYSVQAPVPGGASGSPTGLANPVLADFDNDGFLDLAASGTTATDAAVFVYRGVAGAGTYTFVLQTTLAFTALPSELTAVRSTDFTNDGLQDVLATADSPAPSRRGVMLRTNQGGFMFGPLHSSSTVVGPTDIDICVDYDGDQLKDLVVVRPEDPAAGIPGSIDVYSGVGSPFQPQPPFIPPQPTVSIPLPPGTSPVDARWIECDYKNNYDLAVAVTGAVDGVLLLRNLGPPAFFQLLPGVGPSPTLARPVTLRRGDFDFDGFEDVFAFTVTPGQPGTKAATIELLAIQDCQAQAVATIPAGQSDTSVAPEVIAEPLDSADVDMDGKLDLVSFDHTSAGPSLVEVRRNVSPAALALHPTRPLLGQKTAITFELNVPSQPNAPFLLLFSAAGTHPGTPAGGTVVPLNLPLLPVQFQGTLDAQGRATVVTPPIQFPKAPTFFSLQVAAAAILPSPTGSGFGATNPALLTLP